MVIAKRDPIILELAAKVVAANVQLGLDALKLGANGLIIADEEVLSCSCLSETTIPIAERLGHLLICSNHKTSVTI